MKHSSQSYGFTLVELAIALMVIGLLIGGVLKGQELVQNARVTATIRDIKAFETAAVIFRNAYAALPGDMTNPQLRLPDCTTAPCNTPGNKDGRVVLSGGPQEERNFWVHLGKANMLANINPDLNTASAYASAPYFDAMPENKLGGIFIVQHMVSFANGLGASYPATGGNMLLMYPPSGSSVGPVKANQAAQVDQKLDDGKALTGEMVGYGMGATCHTAGVYLETDTSAACLSIYRMSM